MTERENFMLAYERKQPAWIPCSFDAYYLTASSAFNNKGIPGRGGRDMFGVNWMVTADTGFMATPDPYEHILDDICKWREVVQFPDVDSFDWEHAVKRDLAEYDREEKLLCMFTLEGNFNRLQSIVGVCEGLIALLEEPEEVYEFFKAHTEFMCKINEKIIEYYKPDIIVCGDDICSSEGLMFSREIYDELIKPFELIRGRCITEKGVILEHHVCGKAEAIIPDIIETGATIWQTAQPMNDLVKIQKNYGDRLMINGGWDSFGAHNFESSSEDMVRNEVRRCIDAYGNHGHYELFPVMLGQEEDEGFKKRCQWASEECKSYSKKYLTAV